MLVEIFGYLLAYLLLSLIFGIGVGKFLKWCRETQDGADYSRFPSFGQGKSRSPAIRAGWNVQRSQANDPTDLTATKTLPHDPP